MKDSFLIENLKIFFESEISNSVIFQENQIIVFLDDGTKVKLTTKM